MKTILYYPRLEPYKSYHYAPISLLAVASTMHDKDIVIIDERVDPPEKLEQNIKQADTIMFSAYTGYQVTAMYEVAKWVKQNYPGVKVVLGGPHATIFPRQCLADPNIDEVFCGYAERGEYELPWSLVGIEKYVNPETERMVYVSSYGCVGKCTFCAQKKRRELVFIPLDKVERDIDNLMALHKFKECVMFDATCFTKPARAFFIANLMQKHGLKWIADSRADEICKMPADMLDEIMQSGITQLTVGLETGSERIAMLMKKGRNHLEKYRKAAEIMSRYDVWLTSGVIFGCPGETPADIRQTIDYIKQIREINPNFHISTTFFKPLPSTELSDICVRNYGYREPQSLEEWAKQGEQGHFYYNQFDYAPWIVEPEEYRAIYEQFRSEYGELFV